MSVLATVFVALLAAPEPTAPAVEPDAPPIQRPSTLPPRDEPPPPRQPPVVDPAPQPEPPLTPPEPEPPLTPPQPEAPASAPALPPALPVDEIEAAPQPPALKPISAAFRRPGIWVAVGTTAFAVSTLMRFLIPSIARNCQCSEGVDCGEVCHPGAVIGLTLGAYPLEALALVSAGFAGRSYGLRDARRTDVDRTRLRRTPFVGAGIACVAAGGVMTLAASFAPAFTERLDFFGYAVAGLVTGGAALAVTGSVLLGYGLTLPRRVAVRPNVGRNMFGVSLTWRR